MLTNVEEIAWVPCVLDYVKSYDDTSTLSFERYL